MVSYPIVVTVMLITCMEIRAQEAPSFDTPDDLAPAPSNLKHVFIMFRHGIRTPIISLFPISKDSTWPEGQGALTAAGKQLMLHVGKSLKTRYQNIVPDFDETTVRFTSTRSQRAIMSAESVAAGMFPPHEPVIDDIPTWQPVPVFLDTPYDKALMLSKKRENSECPQFAYLRENVLREEKVPLIRRLIFRVINKKLEETYSLRNYVKSLRDLFHVSDTFKMLQYNSKPIPRWADTFMNDMQRLVHTSLWRMTHSKETMNFLMSGPMFHQIINEFEEQVKLKDSEPKLHLHGSHDTTLCPFFWTIAQDEMYHAELGDAIILELYDNQNVKLYLYSPLEKNKNKRFQSISLKPLCRADPCPLPTLRKVLSPLLLDEKQWKKNCNNIRMTRNRKYPQSTFRTMATYKIWTKGAVRHYLKKITK